MAKIVEGYVVFKNSFLRIEHFGGMNDDFIVFNPSMDLGYPDYKIQLVSKVFLRELNSEKLINVNEFDNEFIVINSNDEILFNSRDTNPDFVEFIFGKLFWGGVFERQIDKFN